MVALLTIVIAVKAVNVGVFVDRHCRLIHGERLGPTATRDLGTRRLGRLTLGTFVLHAAVAGELGATEGELLGATVEAPAGHARHLEASIAGEGALRHRRAGEVQAGLLLVTTLVAGPRAGWELVAVAPGCLSTV